MRIRFISALLLAGAVIGAHPMGNFSVNHYASFEVSSHGTQLRYVLDLAEIPSFELLRGWGLDRNSPQADLNRKAAEQAREWAGGLTLNANGTPVHPFFEAAEIVIADGAGNLPILRITSRFRFQAAPGQFQFEDNNYPNRAGWKEIVIRSSKDARISLASQGSEDRSKALTEYPPDPTVAPPQDLRASVEWTAVEAAPVVAAKPHVIKPVPQPFSPPPVAPATMTQKAAPAGSVVRGDFLSRVLHQRELTFGMMLIALAVAFGLGAAHALTPGHGKTIVAAYLVGSRGTLKHAAFLGAMVTFTHTVSVFLLGIATLFLFRYIMPEKITQVLGAISGLSIIAIGGWMVWKRFKTASKSQHKHPHHHHHHHHDHEHPHEHSHTHDHHHHHEHDHAHPHEHSHSHALTHSHGGRVHTHHVPDQLSWGGLVALGASGGLVPCESALVLLLSAIAIGRVGLGLLLLISFSIGLASVLMAIGILVVFAKHLIPQKRGRSLPALRWIPVFSGALVVTIGILMTAVSLGWLAPKWMLG